MLNELTDEQRADFILTMHLIAQGREDEARQHEMAWARTLPVEDAD